MLSGTCAASFEKLGTGTLTFSGANLYTGTTTVTGGVLVIDTTGSIASANVAVAGGAGLRVLSSLAATANLDLTAGGAATFSGNQTLGGLFGAAGSTVEFGNNLLSLAAGSYAGTVHGAAGNLQINGSTTLAGTVDVGGTLTIANGTLVRDGAASVTTPIVNVLAGATLDVHATGPDVLVSSAIALDVASASLSIGTVTFAGSQTLANLTGNGAVGIASSGVLTLNAASFDGALFGDGSVVVNPGVGNDITLSGTASSFTGGTTNQSGTLHITNDSSLGQFPGAATKNKTFFKRRSTKKIMGSNNSMNVKN